MAASAINFFVHTKGHLTSKHPLSSPTSIMPSGVAASQGMDGSMYKPHLLTSNIIRLRNGVAKQIEEMERKAIYTHCYGHSINLAASDTLQGCKVMKTSLETTHEITKLVKYSPRRQNLFDDIKEEMAPDDPGIRVLCPTKWSVRADSMKSIICNYEVLNELWETACSIVRDTETIARIRGVAAQMSTFSFYFGLVLGEMLLRHSDNLNKTLQHEKMLAAEGQMIASMTNATLASLRNDVSFGKQSLEWLKKIMWRTQSFQGIEKDLLDMKMVMLLLSFMPIQRIIIAKFIMRHLT